MLRQLKIPKKIDHETLLENGYLDEALERIEQKYNPHAIDYGNPYGNPMKIAFSRLPLEERYDMVFSPLLRWKRLGALEIFQEDIQFNIFARFRNRIPIIPMGQDTHLDELRGGTDWTGYCSIELMTDDETGLSKMDIEEMLMGWSCGPPEFYDYDYYLCPLAKISNDEAFPEDKDDR